jgi:hypothetical protein
MAKKASIKLNEIKDLTLDKISTADFLSAVLGVKLRM